MKIEIHPIDADNFTDICKIHNQGFSKCINTLGKLYGYCSITESDVINWFESKESYILVAFEDNEPSGYVHYKFEIQNKGKNSIKQIIFVETFESIGQSKIVVIPNKRRKSISTLLLKEALNRAKKQNAEVAVVFSYNQNLAMNTVLQNLEFFHTPIFYYPSFSTSKPFVHDTILAEFDLTQKIPKPISQTDIDIVIREYKLSDLDDIQQIFTDCRPDMIEKTSVNEVAEYWLKQKWAEKTLIAELNGEAVGCMEYNEVGLIGILGVKKDHQGKGIGTKLLYELLRDMQSYGYTKALADTGIILSNAIRLYRKLGFNTSRELWAWIKILS